MNKNYLYIGGVALVVGVGVWFLFFSGSSTAPTTAPNTTTSGETRTTTVGTQAGTQINVPSAAGPAASGAAGGIIFKIDNGPVAAATFIQTTRPTTTIARYVMQENAHVFDLAVDTPGAVARSVSNTTVPGIAQAQWAAGGTTALLQYIDGGTVKTLSLTFPPASASSTDRTARMRFLPDGITGAAFSPDGKSVAYLLTSAGGADGYTAQADGSSAKKLFSLPLSQLVLSWPSAGTLLAYTKSYAGVSGIVFFITTTNGSVTPLLYAEGISATADRTLSYVMYQTTPSASQVSSSYVRNMKTGINTSISFDPYPEKCAWSPTAAFGVYCTRPLSYASQTYIDGWHKGTDSASDGIFGYNFQTHRSAIIAVPGGKDGGIPSDILSLAVSPGDQYLLFIKKDDRSLWGVRLGN